MSSLPCVRAAWLAGERHDDAVAALLGLEADPRVSDFRGADELVERDAMRLSDRQEQFEARLALSRLEAGQRALRYPRHCRQLRECDIALGSHSLEARSDLGEYISD